MVHTQTVPNFVVYVYTCVYVYVYGCSQRLEEEGVGFSKTGVTDGCWELWSLARLLSTELSLESPNCAVATQ